MLVRGYAAVIPNNQLKNDSAFAGLPGNARLLAAALSGGDPNNAPYGLERIDWDPRTRTCSTKWANRELSIPNGIPSMSTASGLIYGIGQRSGTWGLEGIDFETGESRLRVDAAATPDNNAAYAATTVGPDGAVWTGTLGGYTIFRGPVRPAPRLVCLDTTRPRCKPADRSGSRARLRLRCTTRGVRARLRVHGAHARRVSFYARGLRVATDRRRPFTRVVARRGAGRPRITARVKFRDGGTARTSRRAPRCR